MGVGMNFHSLFSSIRFCWCLKVERITTRTENCAVIIQNNLYKRIKFPFVSVIVIIEDFNIWL